MALHSCDNPICCNPKHLSWGSAQDNMTDKCNKGRYVGNNNQKGEETANHKLKESDVLAIRKRHSEGGITIAAISKEYGVSSACISYIVNRQTWTHI